MIGPDATGWIAAVPYSDKTPKEHAASLADAHLIAAAPDLYEALHLAMEWITGWDTGFTYDDEWPDDEAKIRAALAKARGEIGK